MARLIKTMLYGSILAILSAPFSAANSQESDRQNSTQNQAAPGGPRSPLKYAFPKQQTVELDGDLLGRCLVAATVLSEQPYYFSKDEMISPFESSNFEFYIRALRNQNYDHTGAADLYKTGKEEKLKAWINSQADDSVDPLHLYLTSLKVNSGNVWNALLAVHDLLRNNARFYHTKRYNYADSQVHVEHMFNKLIDIRGDLQERGDGYVGDHFGSWYRIWALLLIAQSSQGSVSLRPPEDLAKHTSDSPDVSFSGIKALFVSSKMVLVASQARYNERSKSQNNPELDFAGKEKIDTSAAIAGAQMCIKLWIKPMSATEARGIIASCNARAYLKSK